MNAITIEQIIAAIPAAFGSDFSGKAWSKGGYERVYVTRYGRQERGYIEVSTEGNVDCGALNLAGMSTDTAAARLLSAVQS